MTTEFTQRSGQRAGAQATTGTRRLDAIPKTSRIPRPPNSASTRGGSERLLQAAPNPDGRRSSITHAAAQRHRRAAHRPRADRDRRGPHDPLAAHAGDATLWLPGDDHAGIATQNVVERELAKSRADRHDLGREEVPRARLGHGCAATRHRSSSDQLRRLGASCDWTRERFTLDAGLSRAVRKAFVRLYEKGLIYRGERIINWCPTAARSPTSRSRTRTRPASSTTSATRSTGRHASRAPGITVATTRPETMLGDTGVAVHPDDARYNDLIGSDVHPAASSTARSRSSPTRRWNRVRHRRGEGHARPTTRPTSRSAQRHNLPIINVMNLDGTMNENAGPYAGQRPLPRRAKAWWPTWSSTACSIKSRAAHPQRAGHCERCEHRGRAA